MKSLNKFLVCVMACVCAFICTLSFAACGDNGDNSNSGGDDNTHTKHNWSTTYTPDGDRHYQTCDGCDEKQYSNHDYGTSGVCVCGKTKPAEAHTKHNWSTTYTPDGDRHYQTCDGCTEKQYSNHDYGTSGVCVCGKQQPDNYVAVTSVTLNKSEITLDIDDTETLTAIVKPDEATYKTVSWSSDKPEIADVDDNGTVTAKADGTAIITATADGVKATCTVTVNKADTPTTNKYAEIVAALEVRIEQAGYENVEVLTIYEYTAGSNIYLACKVKTETGVYGLCTRVSTDGHSLTAENIDTTYYIENIPETRISSVGTTMIKGVYNSDGTDDEKQMVQNMVTKLLGDGYTVMYGSISATRNQGTSTGLGDSASFDIKALLEKDGSVFDYSETLTVSKDYGDVYQAVLKSTEENKQYIYRSEIKELTDLGELAKAYMAELAKQ